MILAGLKTIFLRPRTTILCFSILVFLLQSTPIRADYLLVPMDENTQRQHLKAYGIAFWVLERQQEVQWLLNYRGGSFLIAAHSEIERECRVRGVSFEKISASKASSILEQISNPASNMEAVKLEKAPKIAVYSPPHNSPWDDAVTLVLTYAEIPYDVVYDKEVLNDELSGYDWLHLHHEDFTGQYGKFYAAYRNAPWYIKQKRDLETMAAELGFSKVSQMKLAVVERIKEFTVGGGFTFAMCSATDTYDIALAAAGLDICESMYDGDPSTPNYNSKLDYSRTFAFRNFSLVTNPMEYEYSDIDVTNTRNVKPDNDYFGLFEFSAKWDVVPAMLTQNHTRVIKGFMGQTTAFRKSLIKPNVVILGENKSAGEVRYIHGEVGKGFFTFYGGHDPEDYQHRVGDPPTDLNMYPNSPGYRLILNNVLFPAARKEKQKT
ncbi:MAG: asparagine synthetase B [Flavobacteriales bacterium]|nr:MAG: asparagine synthetase B [Flavobacteriales bacterium]